LYLGCFKTTATTLYNAAQDGYEGVAQFLLSATLAPKESYGHRPLITVVPHCPDSYREVSAITDPAFAEPFIAAGAAVAFIRCFFIVFLRCSWSRRTASAWYFFPIEKGKAPAHSRGGLASKH
jgi:hypothetical protein